MPKLSDERLAAYRGVAASWDGVSDDSPFGIMAGLIAHIDAQQERIDALEAERAEMRREFRIIEADGTVYAEGDVALEGDYTRDLQPGDALYRRDTYTGPWLPVQEDQ